MTAICDDDMNIIGIFTDGDLRRVFDTGVDMRDASIADVMTRGGIRIRPGTLAVDALNLMQSVISPACWLPMATICWVWYICTICCARA